MIGPFDDIVSEARFVPPPPGDQLTAGVRAWMDWINADNGIPLVVKMALGHYQFETLHPFTDGNGRLGRLVCVLQLARAGDMRLPVLNLSPWLEKRRAEYQDHLLRCSQTGEFEAWVEFFSEAVRAQAVVAVRKSEALHDWRDRAMEKLHRNGVRGIAVRITEDLIGYPITTPSDASRRYGITYPGASRAIGKLVELGMLEERTGRKYGKLFAAEDLLTLLIAE